MIPRRKRTPAQVARPYPTHTNLGKIMAHLNMTAAELGTLTGLHHSVITDLLAGRRELTLTQRRDIAKLLDVPVKWLGSGSTSSRRATDARS